MKLFKQRTQDEAYSSFLSFLFPGKAIEFVNDTSDPTGALINALAKEIVRVLNSMNDLSEDYDILVTSQLLSKWESALGIPDECFPATGTDAERRLHVLLKFAKMNVQTAEQMRQLAVALGFTDTMVVPLSDNSLPPYDVPFIPNTTPNSRYVIQVTASGAVTNFPPYDVPFTPSSVNESLLSCIFNIIKPANCKVIFNNTPLASFKPTTIASNIGWYDGDDFNSMTLDASALIASWTNKSSGSSDVIQTIDSLKPRYVGTVQNGRGIVRCNGSLLHATTGDVLNIPTGDNTIMYVARKNNGSTPEFLLNWQTSGLITEFVSYQDDSIAAGSGVLEDSGTVEDQFEVITIFRSGTTQSIQVDSNTPVTNTSGADAAVADTFEIGSWGGSFGLNGDIGEIAIFNEALSTDDITLMKSYFLEKWNV